MIHTHQLPFALLMAWLSGDALTEGNGAESNLENSWPWAPWVTALLLILTFAFVLAAYLQEDKRASRAIRIFLAAVRMALLGLVVVMMYGFVVRPFRVDLPEVVVLLDDSASMSIEDRTDSDNVRREMSRRLQSAGFDDLSRISQAKTLLLENDAALLKAMEANYRLKLCLLSSSAELPSTTPPKRIERLRQIGAVHPRSPVGDCLFELLDRQRGRSTAAVLLLTDGNGTEGRPLSDAARYASRKGIPLFAVALGNDRPARDVELSDLIADEVVYVHDTVSFEFNVANTGYEGKEVDVRLREEGQTSVLARTTIALGGDGQKVRGELLYQPESEGDHEYVIEVEPLDGEVQTENNAQRRRVRVSDEKIRVLLVQADPNYEFRYLKNALGRTVTVPGQRSENPFQLVTVLQDADLEYVDTDSTARPVFPVRLDELLQFDVIVFGDVDPAYLSEASMRNLVEFVRTHGRGMVFIAGPRFTPFAYVGTPLVELMPFDVRTVSLPPASQLIEESFVVRPTRLGLSSPQMRLSETTADNLARWQQLPALRWRLDIQDPKPGARILAEHPVDTDPNGRNLPLILLHYVGSGKVVFHAIDETWRWRFRQGDAVFARYWTQTIRLLSRYKLGQNREVQLATDRQRYWQGEPVELRIRFFDDRMAPAQDDGVTVIVQQDDHKSRQITLARAMNGRGVFMADVDNLEAGNYHAWMANPVPEAGVPACDFSVRVPDNELARIEANVAELKPAAEGSHGRFYTFATAGTLARDLPKGRRVRVESLPPQPVWNSWKIALPFVALLVTEWLIRKKHGLP